MQNKKYTNQLIQSQSPYLQQHAHNPVNWFMWSDKVIQKARDENKPILVSIGYSSCHWCHVMERESFEDENVAFLMNENFINIKIDREERPDLDHIYMDALQAMTGSGGWPLNVFLTPDLKPFYGGTYFPPIAAHGRMSWQDTLIAVSKAFNERKSDIEQQAEKLTEHIKKSNFLLKNSTNKEFESNEALLDKIADNLLKNADEVWGGFGNAPKFPQTFSIQFLLRHYHFTKNEQALKQATLSLDKMIFGGINDHLGGGFARYSVDEKWFAPHFEKMLYDNALIVSVLSEAYQVTKNNLYKETIANTLAFIEREMMNEEFGFYSALDADSEGVEGKFYTWQKSEIIQLLDDDAQLFCDTFNIKEAGNWEHTNILWIEESLDKVASKFEKSYGNNFLEIIEKCKKILFEERSKRVRPLLDDKSLCSWNCLMNVAYCKAFASTGLNHYKKVAENNISFLLNKMIVDDELKHCYKNGIAYNDAFLDDYAYLIYALIHLQEVTGNTFYLKKAYHLFNTLVDKFGGNDNIFFTYTAATQKNIIAQKIEVYDGATPSANSIVAYCINYFSVVYDDHKLRKRFLDMITPLSSAVINYPSSFGVWATLYQTHIKTNKEIVVSGVKANTVLSDILKVYHPNKVLVCNKQNTAMYLPICRDKQSDKDLVIYLCQNFTCIPPFYSLSNFLVFYNI